MPPESHRQRLVGAALSAVALALIVVAIPVVLYKLGGIPSFHIDMGQAAKEISHHPDGQHLISHWLMRAALVMAWVSWVWMTLCVALEIRSRFTGPRIDPASGESFSAVVGSIPRGHCIGNLRHGPRDRGTENRWNKGGVDSPIRIDRSPRNGSHRREASTSDR